MIQFSAATDASEWDAFLTRQVFRPFLQGWTIGQVYQEIGQEPVRVIAKENNDTQAVCFGHVVHAKRGKHLSIPYGPILDDALTEKQKTIILLQLIDALKIEARRLDCTFLRISPFWHQGKGIHIASAVPSPLHLLAEHIWYLPLTTDAWGGHQGNELPEAIAEETLLKNMRKTTRNLIRRAERDGVTITASANPIADLHFFIELHDETRKRHGFTAYSDQFFQAQVRHFSQRNELTLYLAHFEEKVIAASIHMHAYGETSYHHGASSSAYQKIPSSYLLQWTAIRDAIKRGDTIYNFWGIAPEEQKNHPFAGVTLFKTGFGGMALPLVHCMDIPLSKRYWLTYAFETIRKWRRGF